MRFSPFQMYENSDMTGIVKRANLAYRNMIEPQVASQMVRQIHAVNRGYNLNTYLSKFPTLKLESDEAFTWRLSAGGKKNVPLKKCSLTVDGAQISVTDKVGQAGAIFYLTFAEAYFTDVNVIVGERNEIYQIRILADPKPVGQDFAYKCELLSGDPNKYIPYNELVAGKRFSKEFSPVGKELSKKGGGTYKDFPFEMINEFTMIRMEETIPGSMKNRPVKFDFIGYDSENNPKRFTTWLDYLSYQLEMQFQDEIAHLIMYSQSNKTDEGTYKQLDKSGTVLQEGAGIKQQMEASNFYTYNEFSIKKFTEMLLDLSVGKTPMGNREITVMTGEYGMYEFSLKLEEYASLYTPLNDTSRVAMNGNKMTFKGQFLEYRGPNGVVINLVHDALKDDPARNKLRMPGKPGFAESYVYDILNLGGSSKSNGGPNIQRVELASGGEIRRYIPGLRDPYTMEMSNAPTANPIDAWVEHRAFTGGAIVYDPTLTATYKPNILA